MNGYTLQKFIGEFYEPWARMNKASYQRSDAVYLKVILAWFGDLKLNEVTLFQVEQYKRRRMNTPIVFVSCLPMV